MAEPQYIVDKIDNEGWPDALEWLYAEDFGDEELNQLIYEATQTHNILAGYLRQIQNRAEDLGVDWYIG